MGYMSYEEWKDETDAFFDHLSDDEWSAKYWQEEPQARCYGWYMEDKVVRIDDEGTVFEKSAADNYKEYKRGK